MESAEVRKRKTAYMRAWRLRNPNASAIARKKFLSRHPNYHLHQSRKWKAANPEKFAASKRRNQIRKYGLTPEQYDEMVRVQNGKCAICHRVPTRNLDIDHSHVTGKVRGLLCSHCNKGIGMFHDNRDYLLSAIEYLKL